MLAPLPLSFTWGCQQVVSLGLLLCFKNSKTKQKDQIEHCCRETGDGDRPRITASADNGVICQMRYLHSVTHTCMKLASVCGVTIE
jgi:hypothetical protein